MLRAPRAAQSQVDRQKQAAEHKETRKLFVALRFQAASLSPRGALFSVLRMCTHMHL